MALDLFDDDFETESHKETGFYSRDDFTEFGIRVGIPEKRAIGIIDFLLSRLLLANELLDKSFLDISSREKYREMVRSRGAAVGYSYRNR
jgi:hypothetical protein